MPKTNLQEQLKSLSNKRRASESEFSFPNELMSPAIKGQQFKIVPANQMVEYTDEEFLKVSGRPQPFNEYNEDKLNELAESISKYGILEPIIIRPLNGKYQIIAGRNRRRASIQAGITELPCIVRTDIDNAKAACIMIETNLRQREHLAYSEKAWAYRVYMELHGKQGQRNDLDKTKCNGCTKLDTLSEIGKKNDDSRRTVSYYIRLTYLIPSLLKKVDSAIINFKVGVALSYLSVRNQELINELQPTYGKIKLSDIKAITELEKLDNASTQNIEDVFKQRILSEQNRRNSNKDAFTIKRSEIPGFEDLSDKEMKQLFLEFLTRYKFSH